MYGKQSNHKQNKIKTFVFLNEKEKKKQIK